MGSQALIQPFVWYHIEGAVCDFFVRCRASSNFYGNDGEMHKVADSFSSNRSMIEPPTSMTQVTCSGKFYLYSVGLEFHERVGAFHPKQLATLPMDIAEALEKGFPVTRVHPEIVPQYVQQLLTKYLKERNNCF